MRVYDYSAQELLVYDDTNYPVYDGHPRMQNLVYVDRHVQVAPAALSARALSSGSMFLQPSKDTCMSGILQSLHGSIDAPAIIHQLLASTQSGDMHTAVYDFAANALYELFSPTRHAFSPDIALFQLHWNGAGHKHQQRHCSASRFLASIFVLQYDCSSELSTINQGSEPFQVEGISRSSSLHAAA